MKEYRIKLILETEISRYKITAGVNVSREMYGEDADGNRGEMRDFIEINKIDSIMNEENDIELSDRIRSRDKNKPFEGKVMRKLYKWFDDNIDISHISDAEETELEYQADLKRDEMIDEGPR